VNPQACGEAVRALIAQAGVSLKVAVITGDDLMGQLGEIPKTNPVDMFTGSPLPDPEKVASINAYLGAFPIAKALGAGADIIITGRVVDSAVTLGACIHEFGWNAEDWDLLASGSLCGHILECGPQVTGGNFTDWELAGDISNIGYPIAEISDDGSFITTKPPGTSGLVSVGTVSEQMLYEIGDPQNYILPDVICDFSDVTLTQISENRVQVSSAKGRAAPDYYKTCLTYADGFRAGTYLTFCGVRASAKANAFANAVLKRAENSLRASNLGAFSEVSQEVLGAGSQMGTVVDNSEVVLKIAVKHPSANGVGIFLKDLNGSFLATPPGLSAFSGAGRPRPSPVVRLFSYLTPKQNIDIQIDIDGDQISHTDIIPANAPSAVRPELPNSVTGDTFVTVEALAWGRSGDKGDKANIGIIARHPDFVPALWSALTAEFIGQTLAHFMKDPAEVERFYLPGSNAINFLIDRALGGGGTASLRNDAQGKSFAQIILAQEIQVPETIAMRVKNDS